MRNKGGHASSLPPPSACLAPSLWLRGYSTTCRHKPTHPPAVSPAQNLPHPDAHVPVSLSSRCLLPRCHLFKEASWPHPPPIPDPLCPSPCLPSTTWVSLHFREASDCVCGFLSVHTGTVCPGCESQTSLLRWILSTQNKADTQEVFH